MIRSIERFVSLLLVEFPRADQLPLQIFCSQEIKPRLAQLLHSFNPTGYDPAMVMHLVKGLHALSQGKKFKEVDAPSTPRSPSDRLVHTQPASILYIYSLPVAITRPTTGPSRDHGATFSTIRRRILSRATRLEAHIL